MPLFGIAAIWVNRAAADRPFSLGFAFRETVASSSAPARATSPAPFGGWFPLSVVILAAARRSRGRSRRALAPWRYELEPGGSSERERARSLVVHLGRRTRWRRSRSAPTSRISSREEHDAVLAYRVVGGVAIVSGDPIGAPAAVAPLVARFLAFARERGWRVAVLGASEGALPLYASLGLRPIYHGDEAILDVDGFSLEGRAIRKVRQSVQRLAREGYSVQVLRAAMSRASLRSELDQIATIWRGGEPRKGFVMAFDTLFGPADAESYSRSESAPSGRPEGFVHFAFSPACEALSLSSMPRLRHDTERIQRVADLRDGRMGARARRTTASR